MAGRKKSDNPESAEEFIRKFLSKYNKILERNLKKYDLLALHGYFVAISFLMSICFGLWFSIQYFPSDGLGFYAMIAVLSIISALVVFSVIAAVLVHIYKSIFSTTQMIRTVLAYQIITLALAMLLSFIVKSPMPIQFGLFVFTVLIFVHPIVSILYKKKSDVKGFNKTIHQVYTIFAAMVNILNFVINHSSILKLFTG
ncbi:MAG: hypothetical protein ACREAR_03940 [Nitrosotalea sp.]